VLTAMSSNQSCVCFVLSRGAFRRISTHLGRKGSPSVPFSGCCLGASRSRSRLLQRASSPQQLWVAAGFATAFCCHFGRGLPWPTGVFAMSNPFVKSSQRWRSCNNARNPCRGATTLLSVQPICASAFRGHMSSMEKSPVPCIVCSPVAVLAEPLSWCAGAACSASALADRQIATRDLGPGTSPAASSSADLEDCVFPGPISYFALCCAVSSPREPWMDRNHPGPGPLLHVLDVISMLTRPADRCSQSCLTRHSCFDLPLPPGSLPTGWTRMARHGLAGRRQGSPRYGHRLLRGLDSLVAIANLDPR